MGGWLGIEYFNPHSHKGSDISCVFLPLSPMISIHTPTKGATKTKITYMKIPYIFQSTLPQRERRSAPSEYGSKFEFQSTLPQRERLYRSDTWLIHGRFQSTLPQRERLPGLLIAPEWSQISIHTPTKGATQEKPRRSLHQYISIHTPTKGATAILTNNFLIFCSISLINFILYLQIIQILFIFRYKFIFYFIF